MEGKHHAAADNSRLHLNNHPDHNPYHNPHLRKRTYGPSDPRLDQNQYYEERSEYQADQVSQGNQGMQQQPDPKKKLTSNDILSHMKLQIDEPKRIEGTEGLQFKPASGGDVRRNQQANILHNILEQQQKDFSTNLNRKSPYQGADTQPPKEPPKKRTNFFIQKSSIKQEPHVTHGSRNNVAKKSHLPKQSQSTGSASYFQQKNQLIPPRKSPKQYLEATATTAALNQAKNGFFMKMSPDQNMDATMGTSTQQSTQKMDTKADTLRTNKFSTSSTAKPPSFKLKKTPSPPNNTQKLESPVTHLPKKVVKIIKRSTDRQSPSCGPSSPTEPKPESRSKVEQPPITSQRTNRTNNQPSHRTVNGSGSCNITSQSSLHKSQSNLEFDEQEGPEEKINQIKVSLKASLPAAKPTVPLRSINFVNMKNHKDQQSPDPPLKSSLSLQKAANIINLNPHGKKQMATTRGPQHKKVNLPINIVKVIRQKSKSPDTNEANEQGEKPKKFFPIKNFDQVSATHRIGGDLLHRKKINLKVRHSPSPPNTDEPLRPGQQKPVTVSLVDKRLAGEEGKKQEQALKLGVRPPKSTVKQQKPELAKDMLKNLINKSQKEKPKPQAKASQGQGQSQGDVPALRKVKIRRSPPRGTSGPKGTADKGLEALNFTTDMKKHGFMADIQGVQETKKKLIIKQRHISPPPYLNGGEGEKQKVELEASPVENVSPEAEQVVVESLPPGTKASFKFPFQRRARSLSLNKNKDQKSNGDVESTEGQNFIHAPALPKNAEHRKASPEAQMTPLQVVESVGAINSQYDSSKPIVAKDNFVLAHKNLVPGVHKLIQQQQEDEIMMGKPKEVDEWLLGSGESCTSYKPPAPVPAQDNQQMSAPLNPLEKAEEEKEETWMFRTFSKMSPPQPTQQPIQEDDGWGIEEEEFGSDPLSGENLMAFIQQM